MDTLRSTNLSSIILVTNSNNNNENENLIKGSSSNKQVNKVDKDNVSKLVKTFSELTKSEKILFLINIREFTKESSNVLACNNGSLQNQQQQESNGDNKEQQGTNTRTTDPPSNTPQSLRLSRTSNWLQKTFIQDTQVALPKEEVYSLYKHEFTKSNEKAISTADFGKLMRQVFPDVKARRLGQRGQSKYCYANIRKRSDVEKPALPTPLPSNELLVWAKNKFNIDFGDVSQVVSFLRSEGINNNNTPGSATRKRRASCGGNLLHNKQKNKSSSSSSATAATAPGTSSQQRSASVSILETRDDPLLFDSESLELNSYFENSNDDIVVGGGGGVGDSSNASNWPQLRSLLVDTGEDGSNSSSSFMGLGGNTNLGLTKKKRHSSSVQFEFIKPDVGIGLLGSRSQSVPITEMSFIRGGGPLIFDELQAGSSSSSSLLFDEFVNGGNGSSAVVGGGGNNNSSSSIDINNPMFSSAIVAPTTTTMMMMMKNGGCSSSSTSSSSSSSTSSINNNNSSSNNNNNNPSLFSIVSASSGGGESSSSSNNSGGGGGSNMIVPIGSVVGSSSNGGGGDVFFDSVFDLMMSDCQN